VGSILRGGLFCGAQKKGKKSKVYGNFVVGWEWWGREGNARK
jgi:hypothetical protein